MRPATRAIAWLLLGLLIYCAGLEAVTRLGLSRISSVQKRISQDLDAGRSLLPRAANGWSTVLVVGNSLLLEGVDRESLKELMAPKYSVAVLPIENTQFEDWYFGLRRLFQEGSRPSTVVVCLTAGQMLSRSTDGEYFAYYLMQERDLLAVKRESRLDNTITSDYFFANHSKWMGSRTTIRNWLSQRIMPNLDPLMGYFPGKTPPLPKKEQVVASIVPKLAALDQLCKLNGATLVVVIPPPLIENDVSFDLQESATLEGISVVIPLHSSDLTPEDFRDGFHLNQKGAPIFTAHLASELLWVLDVRGVRQRRAPAFAK
jgi:hypothetical protein